MTAQLSLRGDQVQHVLDYIGKEQMPVAVFLQKEETQSREAESDVLFPVGVVAQV
jgi:hypothetical protein